MRKSNFFPNVNIPRENEIKVCCQKITDSDDGDEIFDNSNKLIGIYKDIVDLKNKAIKEAFYNSYKTTFLKAVYHVAIANVYGLHGRNVNLNSARTFYDFIKEKEPGNSYLSRLDMAIQSKEQPQHNRR